MRVFSITVILCASAASAFTPPHRLVRVSTALSEGYVPDGMIPDKWKVQKYKDRHPKHAKHFKSRSLKQFQEELEEGKVRHLFPTTFAKERLKKHQIKPSDVPYMQRGGSFDNSDVNVGYVPQGMSPHQYHDMKRKEAAAMKKKNFVSRGPTSFKSRSLQSFQENLEKGKANHLMPVMFAKQRVKKGLIKQEDVPYMQRGGSWDNSDVAGAKKVDWTATDKKYERGEGPFAFLTAKKPAPAPTKKEPNKKKFFGLFP